MHNDLKVRVCFSSFLCNCTHECLEEWGGKGKGRGKAGKGEGKKRRERERGKVGKVEEENGWNSPFDIVECKRTNAALWRIFKSQHCDH